MSYILMPGGKSKEVKNLGWLLRHWKEVKSLGFNYAPEHGNDGELIARMADGSVYFTKYTSLSVCWQWLNRPVFRGLPFVLSDFTKQISFIIGNDKWKEYQKLEHKELHNKINSLFVY